MRFFLDAHPGLPLWLLLAGALSVGTALLLARTQGLPPVRTGLLVAAVLLPLAITLTPSAGPGSGGPNCISDIRPYRWWGQGGEELANMAMLLPFGLLAPLLLGRWSVPLLLLGACLPVGVEGVQYLVPGLGRSCDVTDLLLNSIGLAVGVVVGTALRLLTRAGAGPSGSPAPPERSGARSR